ncbi:hypothetical protein JCM33374_g1655 [Metschnikowia sp. JCM 33374]|nr:hypothetical protein JCM33374_g1655 [Metschnikowia sp. JCM 33374]
MNLHKETEDKNTKAETYNAMKNPDLELAGETGDHGIKFCGIRLFEKVEEKDPANFNVRNAILVLIATLALTIWVCNSVVDRLNQRKQMWVHIHQLLDSGLTRNETLKETLKAYRVKSRNQQTLAKYLCSPFCGFAFGTAIPAIKTYKDVALRSKWAHSILAYACLAVLTGLSSFMLAVDWASASTALNEINRMLRNI